MLRNECLLAEIGVDTAENERFDFDNFTILQGFDFGRPAGPYSHKYLCSPLAGKIFHLLVGDVPSSRYGFYIRTNVKPM